MLILLNSIYNHSLHLYELIGDVQPTKKALPTCARNLVSAVKPDELLELVIVDLE
jgi:hypothetical protein